MLKSMYLQEFIDKLESSDPVPGGGSVAALSSSLACALSAMVANLTVGKKNYEDVDADMTKIALEMSKNKADFIDFIDKDATSFDGVMKAYKLPKDTDDEKAERLRQIQEGMKHAAQVPLEVAQRTLLLFDSIECLVQKGNKNAQTDALVAAMMARTAILSALFNVKINLGSIKDDAFVQETKKEIERIEALAIEREQLILNMTDL